MNISVNIPDWEVAGAIEKRVNDAIDTWIGASVEDVLAKLDMKAVARQVAGKLDGYFKYGWDASGNDKVANMLDIRIGELVKNIDDAILKDAIMTRLLARL